MTTQEKNILIAKFMGWRFEKRVYITPFTQWKWISEQYDTTNEFAVNELMFDTSWDWLMPVVEKIESIIFSGDEYFNFNILGGCYVIIISSHGDELLTSYRGQSKLECTYDAVVEFIQWYNEQPK